MPTSSSTPGRRGRPRNEDSPEKRASQIRLVGLVLTKEISVKEAAAIAGTTRRTITRWKAEALGYDDPEAEGLRRISGTN